MKRKRHTAEQIVRKLREGDRMLNEGTDLSEVLRHLEPSRWLLRTATGSAAPPGGRRCRRLHAARLGPNTKDNPNQAFLAGFERMLTTVRFRLDIEGAIATGATLNVGQTRFERRICERDQP
jgi:hypothetical protein